MDILRDSIWQFVGAIIAFLAIIITLVIFFIQRKKKNLSYTVISETSLLSISKEVKDKLKIYYGEKPISKLHLIIIKFINSGNVPIVPSDFMKNLEIKFGFPSIILSAEISEMEPKTIDTNLTSVQENIVIKPTLLNSGDSITIKMLVSDYNGEFDINGRIVGVNNINQDKTGIKTSTAILFFVGFIEIATGIILAATLNDAFFILLILGYITLVLPVLWDSKFRDVLIQVLKETIRKMV